MGSHPDTVRLALVVNRLSGIARTMMNTMHRTGRSGIINTARDIVACIVTHDDNVLVIAESLPIMIMSGPNLVTKLMKEWHPDLQPGDAFLHNSPYHGNSHAADHSVLAPILDESGKHRFTVYAKAHVADCGNSIPTTAMPGARDVYEEGALIFPCVKVQQDYQDLPDVIRMCEARIRVPEMWRGDYLAMIGAVRAAERELLAITEEIGWDELENCAAAWLDYSERRMANKIKTLRPGKATATTIHDPVPVPGFENGIPITATVEVRPDDGFIEIDCRDNPDCIPCGINLTEATSIGAALVGVFNSIGRDIPVNGGSFRRVRILLRENCVCGIPVHPFSCSQATTGVADRLAGAVQIAFASIDESVGMAEAGAAYAAADAVLSGFDPRRGDAPYIDLPVLGVTGGPGNAWNDGWLFHVGGTAGMMMRDSGEMDELRHPILIEEDRIVADSEGAGRHRGAPSNLVVYSALGAPVTVVGAPEKTVTGAEGAAGGLDAPPGKQFKRHDDGALEPLPSPFSIVLAPGEAIVSYCAGGGGYGDPRTRDVRRVADDVRSGYVSVDRAASTYGVRVDANGDVDLSATEQLRRSADRSPS